MYVDLFLKNNYRAIEGFLPKKPYYPSIFIWIYAKGKETAPSDIDLLVEFQPEHIPGLLTLSGMEIELSTLFGKKLT